MVRISSSLLFAVLSIHTASAVLNSILPKPVYGVPDGIRYPPPPPDIPPPFTNGPPRPIYGVPDGIRYPPPPPDIPPPQPHKEYGVPILKLGPPKIRYEGNALVGGSGFGGQGGFGGPGFSGKGGFGNHGGFGGSGFGGGHGGSAFSFPNKHFQSHAPKRLSFLDQIKTKFNGFLGDVGFPGGQGSRPFGGHSLGIDLFNKGHSQSYGPPPQQHGPPHGPVFNVPPPQQYGPPQHGPSFNGPPPKFHGPSPNFNGPPPPNFNNGPQPSFNIGSPLPNYGPPSDAGPQQHLPNINGPSFNGPAVEYGPPPAVHQYAPSFSGPSFQSSPGKVLGPQFGGPINSGPPTAPLIKCDGWKPIAGPVGGNIGGQDHSFEFGSNDNLNANVNYDNSDIITHSDLGNLGFGNSGDYNVVKSEGIEFHQTNLISDSFSSGQGHSSFESNQLPPPNYSSLPTGSYLPPSRNPNIPPSEHLQRPQTSYGPPPSGQVLIPPSGIYGVPPGGQYQGLAISHGSISGNLKPWPVQGEAPKRPISFKQPVPQGLIESIGETVKQIDSLSSGYSSNGGYEIQQSVDATGGLYSLPLENSVRPFYQASQLSQDLQLPLQQSAYQAGSIGGNHDCNHGLPQDSYGPPPSGRQLGSSSDISTSVVTSYIPPPSGQVQDNHEAGSNQIEQLSQASALRSGKAETSSSGSEQVNIVENQHDSSISSASSSDSFTIPVQGNLGSYQLQFQSANGLDGSSDGGVVDASTHEQLLSEGLLQQILSAIEHPNQSNNLIVPQTSYDQHISHQDAADFLHSQEGHETLAEPKTNIN